MSDRLTVTARDLRALVALLDPERPGGPNEELPDSFVADLGVLVPCTCASFILMDARHREYDLQSFHVEGSLYEILTPDQQSEISELFWSGYWEEGGCSYVEDTGDRTSVMRTSDFFSRREYSKTLMGEHDRRLGVRHEVMVSLPPVGVRERRLVMFRTDGRDFSEREVLLLTLLRPHLVTVHLRQQRRRQGVPELTPRQWEILRLVAAGCTNTQIARALAVSEATVRKHLENVYGRLDVGSRTAALAKVLPLMDVA
jgi:DNA-binding CsgD family transcriptional regulator